MSKKEEKSIVPEAKEIRKNLTPEEYWEWRTGVAELQLADSRVKHCQSDMKCLEHEALIVQLKSRLYAATNFRSARDGMSEAKNEYAKFKKVLEERTGISLENKVIDGVNFEIKDIPKEEKPVHTN